MSITIRAYYICVSVKHVWANTLPSVLSISHSRLSLSLSLSVFYLSAQRPRAASSSLSVMSSPPYPACSPRGGPGVVPSVTELMGALPSVETPLAADVVAGAHSGGSRRLLPLWLLGRRSTWQLP